MRVFVPAVLFSVALILAIGAFFPVKVKVRAELLQGRLLARVWIKPPVVPWYLKLPPVSRRLTRQETGADPNATSSSASAPKEGPESAGDHEGGSLTGTLRQARNSIEAFCSRYPAMKEAAALIMSEVTFERVKITGKAGTGDAYEAAIICGAANMLTGILVSVAARRGARFRKRPLVRMDPVFGGAHFSFSAEIEISFALAPMLYVSGKTWHLLLGPRPVRAKTGLSSQKSVEY